MAKIKFRDVHLSKTNIGQLRTINGIIEEYQRSGYSLTLRQLYYQLVSRDIIPNKQAEYSKLSTILKEGRMGGYVDWDAIEDRLRRPDKPAEWDSPADIIKACINQYRVHRMEGQETYIEVWVEKDALSGVLKRVTSKYGIPIVVNRGYSSATAMYDAHNRFEEAYRTNDQDALVIYVGDFDPSGQDMIRDILDRINEFDGSYTFDVIPIALTWDQIETYGPPPNPAKLTDPRAVEYIKRYGPQSWEVDALRPEVLHQIVEAAIHYNTSMPLYEATLAKEEQEKDKLKSLIQYL